jgi:hypothetical protein
MRRLARRLTLARFVQSQRFSNLAQGEACRQLGPTHLTADAQFSLAIFELDTHHTTPPTSPGFRDGAYLRTVRLKAGEAANVVHGDDRYSQAPPAPTPTPPSNSPSARSSKRWIDKARSRSCRERACQSS